MDKYTSLVAWQAAHQFVLGVFRLTDRGNHPRVRPVFDQLRRAAISVEANIVEGYALASTAQFRRHLRIARGSGAECECLIRIGRELGYLEQNAIKDIGIHLDTVMKTLGGLLRKL